MICFKTAMRRARSAAVLGFAAVVGCSAEPPKLPLFPTSGQVRVGDVPAEGVEVRFFDAANVTAPDKPHPFATTSADGRFELGTFEAGDGAPVGRYKVMLLWPEGPPGPGVPKDRFGNAYSNPAQSPIEASVAEGEAITLGPFVVDPAILKKAARRKVEPDLANPLPAQKQRGKPRRTHHARTRGDAEPRPPLTMMTRRFSEPAVAIMHSPLAGEGNSVPL